MIAAALASALVRPPRADKPRAEASGTVADEDEDTVEDNGPLPPSRPCRVAAGSGSSTEAAEPSPRGCCWY